MKAKPGTIGNTLAGWIKGLSTVSAVVAIAANAIAGVSSDSAPDVVKCRQWLAERWRQNDANGNPAGERGEPFPIDMPLPWLEIDNYDWFERHNSRVELARTTNPQIVFIGDSITHAWEANDRRGDAKGVFNRWFGKYTTLNLGFGWDRIQNVLWRLEHGEMEGTNPKVVVIHIGTNNTAPGDKYNAAPNPPGEIAEGILAVCRKVRELAPDARIVLMKIFPRGKTPSDPYRGKVAAVNTELDRLLASFRDDKLTVIDMHDKFVDKDGNISLDLTIDYLHPTAKGYDLWGAALAPIIEKECGAAECNAAIARPNDWENPAINSVNREPARTYSMPLADESAAFTGAIEPETPYKMSLNGIWKISWAGNPDLRVKDFYRTDYSDSDWLTIDVPSCVEMRGFGSPGYVNVRYPHKMEWPLVRDRQSGAADYNPVSSYRRTFSVPESWKGREVFIRFDGVYSAYYVWVNGEKVGYAEDSKLPSEFNITKYLKDGENLLAVEVYRWCDGSYLEDQDMTRFSGIFRDVTLWSMPKGGIWDFTVKTRPVDGYESWSLELELENGSSASLYDAENNKIGDLAQLSNSNFQLQLKPHLWSAEKPYLYTLIVRKGGDIRARKVGFKEVKVSGNTILVNGKKIKFKGVNRHETNPDNGRTVSMDDMLRDITLFKKYNINTVRTCHYPDHHLWYDLCDRYGIYVCAEANVEGHEPGYRENGLGRFPEWTHSIVERNLRHVKFYRNHPSVTLWSMGNETGHGPCFTNAIAQVKALDPSRPVHWERGNIDADVDSVMYPSVEWLDRRGKLGDGLVKEYSADMNDGNSTDSTAHTPMKAFFMCEYAHAMGNALGNFQEYWDVFYKYDSLTGGCIWDWVDQAVWKYTDRVGADGKRERYFAYGGDFDEQPNDGPFNCNGVVGPLRDVTAKLVEVGHVYRNLVVRDDFTLENRFGFTYADEFDGEWEIVEDGVPVRREPFAVPHIAPLSCGSLGLPEFSVKDGKETFVNICFKLREDTPWAKKGWEVSRNQIALNPRKVACEPVAAAKPVFVQDDKTITASAGGTKAVFCRRSGTLCELTMNGTTILKDPAPGVVAGPRLTCFRAFTDNDIWLRGLELEEKGNFYLSGLSQLRYHAHPAIVEGNTLRFKVDVTGSKSAGFTHETEWTFGADGAVSVRNTVTPHGTMPSALPRLGLSFKLDKALENMRYYGRGPRENYIDRKTASFFGVYDSTVTEQFEEYVRPQDNGYKCDVRWAEFMDVAGKGVRFSASEPLFMQALHYGAEDLEFARHRNAQQRFRTPLVKRDEVCLNLDIRQLGLGGASCGPRPMDKYMFPIQREEWVLKMEPVDGDR